jgi:hypothetical protein
MNYAKPEVVLTASAVGVIQGTTNPQLKNQQPYLDGNGITFDAVVAAYEADE